MRFQASVSSGTSASLRQAIQIYETHDVKAAAIPPQLNRKHGLHNSSDSAAFSLSIELKASSVGLGDRQLPARNDESISL